MGRGVFMLKQFWMQNGGQHRRDSEDCQRCGEHDVVHMSCAHTPRGQAKIQHPPEYRVCATCIEEWQNHFVFASRVAKRENRQFAHSCWIRLHAMFMQTPESDYEGTTTRKNQVEKAFGLRRKRHRHAFRRQMIFATR